MQMFNPWLSFSIRTVRLGWESQAAVVDQLLRLAGIGSSDRAESPAEANASAQPASEQLAEPPAVSQPKTTTQKSNSRAAPKAAKSHKKSPRGNKRRR
jgi:hypothetical protein